MLHRPVTVHVLPGGEPVPGHVVTALQAAARVNDPRLATVYDTDFAAQVPYIVSEWAPGTHLEDLVLSGLPRPALAAAMIADAADALAVAHKADRPHLRLGPRSLRWDTRSGLKITGLGIEAALFAADQPAASADAGAADTMALGRMLYALLTGFWPGHETDRDTGRPQEQGTGVHAAAGPGRGARRPGRDHVLRAAATAAWRRCADAHPGRAGHGAAFGAAAFVFAVPPGGSGGRHGGLGPGRRARAACLAREDPADPRRAAPHDAGAPGGVERACGLRLSAGGLRLSGGWRLSAGG